jgi:hypothetical protein
MDGWGAQLNALCPPGFPPGEVTFTKGQRFPGADDGVELNVYRLEVLEKVLSCPPFEQQWWGPMRRREPMPMWPVKLIAKMSEDVFDIRFETVRPNQCYTS